MLLIFGKNGLLAQNFQFYASEFTQEELVFLDRVECDLTNIERIRDKVTNLKPRAIINCSGYLDIVSAQSKNDDDLNYKLNAYAVENVAIISKELEIPFIHFSSDYVFDGTKKQPYNIDDKPNPINAYGSAKLLGEQFFLENSHSGAIIRISHLCSPIGKNIYTTFKTLLNTLPKLNIVSDQRVTLSFCYDIVAFTISLLNDRHALKEKQIFHLGSTGEARFTDFVSIIKNNINSETIINPISLEEFSPLVQRPLYSVMNIEKSKTWHDLTSWENSLKELLRDDAR